MFPTRSDAPATTGEYTQHGPGAFAPASTLPSARTKTSRSNQPNSFEIYLTSHADGFLQRLAAQAEHTSRSAFQSDFWLGTWCRTVGAEFGTPLLVEIRERRSGALVAILPLFRRRAHGLRIVEFADCGLSDYNAPILGPVPVTDDADLRTLWDALKKALQPADVIFFSRMPTDIAGRPNPLALLPGTWPSSVNGAALTLGDVWTDYVKSLNRKFRAEIERSWRVFASRPNAVLKRIDDTTEAGRVLATMEQQQSVRLRRQGKIYTLDRPECIRFYQSLVTAGVPGGTVVITALLDGDDVVSALLGITYRDNYVLLRLSRGSEQWSNCSPGRLVIVKTMEMLHAQGCRHFDFSLGEFSYKRRLGTRTQPLRDLAIATSIRGVPLAAAAYVSHCARQNTAVRAIVRRVRGLTTRHGATADVGDDAGPTPSASV